MKKIRFLILALVGLLGGVVSASGKTVYIQPNAWANDNAILSLWTWTVDNEVNSNEAWATLTEVQYENGILKAELDDAINRMILVRGTAANSWDDKWNQTGDIDISEADGKLFVMGDIAAGTYDVADYTEPLLRDYWVEGDAGLISEGWNATDGNKMANFTLTKNNVMLLVGTYGYKVYCGYGDGSWYPSGENKTLEVTENGYYNVTFTFDPATGEPSATATKTEAIGYVVDFNTAITTSDPDFSVASNWKHIVDGYEDYWGDESYVSYQSMLSDGYGWNGTGCFRVYTNQKSNGTYDLLVTPLVSGKVTLYVKPVGKYYNDSAFLELYSLNSDGTEKGSVLATTNFSSKSNSEEWDWTPLTITLAEEQRIGIRGSQVYMDNFLAENATIVPLTEMRVTSVMSLEGQTGTSGTNPSFNQDENGNVLVQLKVTVNNTGDVDLVTGETENYTLTLAQGSSSGATTYFDDATINVPVNIAAGQSATFDVEFSVPASTGYTYFYVRENLTGKTSSSYRYANVVEYASKFIFDVSGTTYYSSSSATTTAINFGKVTEEATVNYEIYNSGSAPLTINSFTLPEPFTSDAPTGEFTVAGGEKKQIAITMPATTPGVFAGNLEIVYTNFGKAQATYTLGISGTVIDTSKNWITFSNAANNNGQFPAGSIHSDYVYISKASSEDNWYLQSTSTTTKFITPLLTAEAGESFTYDAWYSSYNYSCAVKVYTSTDRINWTQVDNQTYSSGIGSTAKTFTVTIPEAGNYYLGFELISNALLDNIYGLTLAPTTEHDWYVISSEVPTTGTQNAEYTASMSLKNISADADVIETATLYVGGEAVATVENITLEGNAKTAIEGTGRNQKSNIEDPVEIAVTYKPHNFGTFPAYIELKSGDAVVKTDEVEVTIAEEEIKSDATIEADGFSNSTPLNLYYKNSEAVSLYTAAILKNNFGLTDGAKISSITYKGYGPSSSHTTALKVWYEWTDDTEQVALSGSDAYDTSNMISLIDEESHEWPSGGSSTAPIDLLTLTFDTPIEYKEGKALRIVIRSTYDGYKNGYYWEKSSISTHPESGKFVTYRHQNDGTAGVFTGSWTSDNLPVIHLDLVVEPTTLAGTVTDGTNPVEGATVTLRNEANDVEYSATTAADGTYSINVIQDKLAYKAVADAEGLVAPVQNVASFDEAVNFTLAEPAYGDLWAGEAAIADVPAGYFKYLAKAGDKLVISYEEEGSNVLKFTKPDSWNNVNVYAWDTNGQDVTAAWPGTALSNSELNEYGQQVFLYEVPSTVAGVIFNNGDAQTVDITDLSVTGYYTDGSYTEGKLNVFSWTDPSNAAVELLDQSGNAIAEATLADGTAEIELTEALMTKLAGGLYAMVKGSAANITKVELVENVVTITMSSLKYATLYYENVNLVVPEGLVAYAAVVGDKVDLQQFAAAGDVIPAGIPVVLGGEAGDYEFGITEETGMAPATNDLIGSEEGGKDEETGYKYYVLNRKNGVAGFYFQKGSAGAYADVKPHQAYLKVDASLAKAGGYGFDDVATGIDSIDAGMLTDNDKVYTLSGVRVNANRVAKGVYIVNGQKVVIK